MLPSAPYCCYCFCHYISRYLLRSRGTGGRGREGGGGGGGGGGDIRVYLSGPTKPGVACLISWIPSALKEIHALPSHSADLIQSSTSSLITSTKQVSVSAQDGIVALGKAHTRSAPSLSSLPKVALDIVPIFVWLNTDRSRPCRVECWPLPFSIPFSFRRSML